MRVVQEIPLYRPLTLNYDIRTADINAGSFALTILGNQSLADLVHSIHLTYQLHVRHEADRAVCAEFMWQSSPKRRVWLVVGKRL